jgi:hypothetical protein
MHKRVLDVEVLLVVEHRDGISIRLFGLVLLFGGGHTGGGVLVGDRGGAVLCDSGHYDGRKIAKIGEEMEGKSSDTGTEDKRGGEKAERSVDRKRKVSVGEDKICED